MLITLIFNKIFNFEKFTRELLKVIIKNNNEITGGN